MNNFSYGLVEVLQVGSLVIAVDDDGRLVAVKLVHESSRSKRRREAKRRRDLTVPPIAVPVV